MFFRIPFVELVLCNCIDTSTSPLVRQTIEKGEKNLAARGACRIFVLVTKCKYVFLGNSIML